MARVLAAGLVVPPHVVRVHRYVLAALDDVFVLALGPLAVGVVGAVGRLRPLVLGGVLATARPVLAAVVG